MSPKYFSGFHYFALSKKRSNLSQQIFTSFSAKQTSRCTDSDLCLIFFLNQHHNLIKYHSTVCSLVLRLPCPTETTNLLGLGLKWNNMHQEEVSHPTLHSDLTGKLGVGIKPHLHPILFIHWMRRNPAPSGLKARFIQHYCTGSCSITVQHYCLLGSWPRQASQNHGIKILWTERDPKG